MSRVVRGRRARRVWLLRVAPENDGPDDYDYNEGADPGASRVLPSAPLHSNASMARFTALKPLSGKFMPYRTAATLLARHQPHALPALRATRSVAAFQDYFLLPPHQRPPPRPIRNTNWPPRLFDALRDRGVVVPIPPPPRGSAGSVFGCSLKAVPDRKDPSLARTITPYLDLNDSSREPLPTPTPSLHQVIDEVLSPETVSVVVADLKGWFHALAIPIAVASVYFLCKYNGKHFAIAHGHMGWRWMPFLMATIAVALVMEACRALEVKFRVWIDNIILMAPSHEVAARAAARLKAVASRSGVVLHETSPPTTSAKYVGLVFDLTSRSWKLDPSWCRRFIESYRPLDGSASLSLSSAWHIAGSCVWVVHAGRLPLVWITPVVHHVNKLIGLWTSRKIDLCTRVAWPRWVRQCVRDVIAYVYANPARRLTSSISRPVFSDAFRRPRTAGIGYVVRGRDGQWYDHSDVADPAIHINVLELYASYRSLKAAARQGSIQSGQAVPLVIDNSVAAYQVHRGSGRSSLARYYLRLLYQTASDHGIGLHPRLIASAFELADGPSRLCEKVSSASLVTDEVAAAFAKKAAPLSVRRPAVCIPLPGLGSPPARGLPP